jgi:hypothetical protein
VSHYFVEKKGKISLPKNRAIKKIRSLRMGLEAKIGFAKNHFKLNRILYNRSIMGDSQWIRLCLLGMNLKTVYL